MNPRIYCENGFSLLSMLNVTSMWEDENSALIISIYSLNFLIQLIALLWFPIASYILQKILYRNTLIFFAIFFPGIYLWNFTSFIIYMYNFQILTGFEIGANYCPFFLVIVTYLKLCTLGCFVNVLPIVSFILVAAPSVIAVGLFAQYVLHYNKKVEKEMHENWRKIRYTLGRRYQVNENIRCLTIASRSLWWILGFASIEAPLFVLFHAWDHPWKWKNLLGATFDFILTIFYLSMSLHTLLIDKKWMLIFKQFLRQMTSEACFTSKGMSCMKIDKQIAKIPRNIVHLYIASISGIYVFLAARVVSFLYQIHLLQQWEFGSDICPTPLLIASLLRATLIASAAGSLAIIMIERLVATIYVETYETSNFLPHLLFGVFANFFISFLLGLAFTFDFISIRIACLMGLMSSFIFALGCQFVLSLNEEAERQMHRNWREFGYSLTKRFQVAENIRNLKGLSKVMWWCMFNSLFFCTLFVIYVEVRMSWDWKNLLGSLIDLHASLSKRSMNEVCHSYKVYAMNRELIYTIATQEEYFRQLDEVWERIPRKEKHENVHM
ncbi:unnamed protein product, partial [Mesorhabditis belari]|uniref:Uncharacterized protein n=1 Tax=Mesorhabditis belari TaxID=2138241 RepID=A0AAF3JBB4_9BILA